MLDDKYGVANTKSRLDHYFGNKVGGVKALMEMDKKGMKELDYSLISRVKQDFIEGMELTIQRLSEGKILESGGIGEAQLREILEVARTSNWAQPSTIKELYEIHSKITGEEIPTKTLEGLESRSGIIGGFKRYLDFLSRYF